jgi:acetylornithine deacetylase/succinyl-diaminopimelate desuccinylase-like protein
MEKARAYSQANQPRFIEELLEVLRIPSVSANPDHAADVRQTAEWLKEKLIKAGAENVELCETAGNPILYGDKIFDPSLPTILVYGHYDVQPADPLELWTSKPFEPVIVKTDLHPEGAIFARGSCDDKGQMYMHFKAFEAMVATNSLPCNVKFIIEGEEEIGSANLEPFVRANMERLKADVVLCSDTSVIANDIPSITSGVRGLTYLEVEVTGPNRDLHSGTYGGGVANPINVLAKMIATLQDEAGRITIPHFYDDVLVESLQNRADMSLAPFNLDNYKKDLDIAEVQGEYGFSTNERTGIRPSLDVNGIWGGYQGPGSKTVLPSKAYAKISMRLVPNMSSKKTFELFKAYFESIAPPSVKVKVIPHHGGEPGVTPVDTPEYQAAHQAMAHTYGKVPIAKREGGFIPIVSLFERTMGIHSVLMGFGLDSDAIHSPNEHYGLFNYRMGIETIPFYYQFYTELKKA